MSLGGGAVVAIWNDIREDARDEFYAWHTRQHIPERVGIPGFYRGRRYIALEGTPQYFTLYETQGPDVLTSAAYLARLNAPTPWTQSVTRSFFNVSRSLCRVTLTCGIGEGGCMMTWRYDVAPGRDAEQQAWLDARMSALAEQPGIAGVHVCIADRTASTVATAENKARHEQNQVPTWVLMVEGGAEPDTLRRVCAAALPEDALVAHGAVAHIERGLYRLQFSRTHTS